MIHPLPLFRRKHNFPIASTDEWHQRLQEMIGRGETEPIGHDLFRSAWDARTVNPRAAIVLGVAALEVGTKDCISRLVPDTAWLVDNVPSPPVADLIGKYLPQLLATRGNLSLFAPPRELVSRVRDAVQHRNTVAHKLPLSQRYEELTSALEYLSLEQTLWTIRDLLALFDVYAGNPRALQRVRSDTLNLLVARHNHRALPEPEYGSQDSTGDSGT